MAILELFGTLLCGAVLLVLIIGVPVATILMRDDK